MIARCFENTSEKLGGESPAAEIDESNFGKKNYNVGSEWRIVVLGFMSGKQTYISRPSLGKGHGDNSSDS